MFKLLILFEKVTICCFPICQKTVYTKNNAHYRVLVHTHDTKCEQQAGV